ncbi:MAG: Lrp/AsnC family transcriptional regulator [Candidatus Nanoarchaeia archaeon]
MKLNKKDSKLLYALAQNSRSNLKQLAQISQFSQESVQKKIIQFKQQNIILSYSTPINIAQTFGLQEYIAFLSLAPTSSNKYNQLIHYLEHSQYTSWIGKGIGVYDIKLSVYIQHTEQLSEFEQEIHSNFSTLIHTIEWNQLIKKYKNSSSSIISNCLNDSNNQTINNTLSKNIQKHTTPQSSSQLSSQSLNMQKLQKLQKIQKQILYELSDNSRITLQELSTKLNTTIENIHYHVKKLQQLQVITHFTITLNTTYFEQYATILLLKIHSSNLHAIIQELLTHTNITSIIEVIGTYNLHITFLHNSIHNIYEEINSIISKYYNEIISSHHFFTHSFYKYPKLPSIILQ